MKLVVFATACYLAFASGTMIMPARGTDYAAPSLRAWQRAHEGHLIIEWAKATRVQQRKTDDRLILRFAEPLNINITSTLQTLDYFVDPRQSYVDGSDLSLALKPGVFSKVNIRERRIVAVDFARNPAEAPRSTIEMSTIDNGVRLTFSWPGATRTKADQTSDQFRLQFSPGWKIDAIELATLQQTLRPWFQGLSLEEGQDHGTLSLVLEPQITSSVQSDEPARTVIDLLRHASVRSAQAETAVGHVFRPEKKPTPPVVVTNEPATGPPIPAMRPPLANEPKAIAETKEREPPMAPDIARPDALVIAWERPVAAAVFIRANHLWAVFDEPDERLLSGLPAGPAGFGPGSLVAAEGGTALRYPLSKPVTVDVSQTPEGHWRIETDTSASAPKPLSIERLNGSALRVTPTSTTQVVSVIDPSVGDELNVMTHNEAGIGQPTRRRFVDLEVLPTLQGLAWRPLNDRLIASIHDQGLELRSPKGLSLSATDPKHAALEPVDHTFKAQSSSVPDKTAKEVSEDRQPPEKAIEKPAKRKAKSDRNRRPEVAEPKSYFRLAGSGVERELVNEYRRIRRQAIRRAAPEDRDRARLNLARLLVSERLGTEARTILNAISEEADDIVQLQKQALEGVSALLIGHFDEASLLLLDSDLDTDDEVDIWRAALESTEDKWQPAAKRWRAKSDILDIYPPRLKLDLGLMALRAAIETDDDKMIRRGMRRLSSLPLDPYDEARFDAMKALKAERSGDLERARALLTGLTESPHPAIRTLADFELASLGLKENAYDLGALSALENRLPLWRGHPEEQAMLDKLARRQVDANALRKALTIWRRLIQLYPDAANKGDLTKARQDAFVQALSNKRLPAIDRIDVYAIYLDFIDLLPGDPEVRDVNRHLAEHLSELDLLDEAIDVFQSLMATSSDDLERAELAAEIAVLMLRQDRAAPALAVLDDSQGAATSQLDPPIEEKRQLARAKALARLDRTDDALLVLRDLQSTSARRLQANILWNGRRWAHLAATVDSYFADADLTVPIATEDQELVLWLALARQRAGNADQLRALRDRFSAAMKGSPYAGSFDVATQDTIETGDIGALLAATGEQLTELQRFREATPAFP